MPTMLPTPSSPVKTLLLEQALIWSIFAGGALLLYLTGADALLARALYHPTWGETGNNWAWFLRQYGTLPATILAILGLIAMFWPRLWQTKPLLYKTALIIALTTIVGVGFLNQIVVKNLADRPRPREYVLATSSITTLADGFQGNSMPSGHAAMGFVLAAAYFPLRRRRTAVANAALATGLIWGSIIGLSRMILGAHFASDVLIAALLALAPASLLTYFIEKYQKLNIKLLALGTLLLGTTILLCNRFTNFMLSMDLPGPFTTITLPCPVETLPTPGQKISTLQVKLNGYGAPQSNLKLIEKNGTIQLQTSHGLYHHLTCTATLAIPETE